VTVTITVSGDEFGKITKPQELGRWDASQEPELIGDGKVPLLSAIPMLTALSGTPITRWVTSRADPGFNP
jgi:hypothetical protein